MKNEPSPHLTQRLYHALALFRDTTAGANSINNMISRTYGMLLATLIVGRREAIEYTAEDYVRALRDDRGTGAPWNCQILVQDALSHLNRENTMSIDVVIGVASNRLFLAAQHELGCPIPSFVDG